MGFWSYLFSIEDETNDGDTTEDSDTTGDSDTTDDSDAADGPEEHWVDDHHYRVVSADGSRSWLYYTETGWDKKCVEVADHAPDGTTYAYEAPSVSDTFFRDGRGLPKK